MSNLKIKKHVPKKNAEAKLYALEHIKNKRDIIIAFALSIVCLAVIFLSVGKTALVIRYIIVIPISILFLLLWAFAPIPRFFLGKKLRGKNTVLADTLTLKSIEKTGWASIKDVRRDIKKTRDFLNE